MTKKHLGILKKSAVQAHPPKLKAKKPKAPKPVLSQPEADAAAGGGKQKRAAAAAAALLQSKTEKHELQQQREWIPHSPVVRFAAEAVAKLIAADESQRSGKSIKSLTLAPHVSTKKATYALTCQTLRYLPVLQKVLEGSDLLVKCQKLTPPVAYVLCYEILFGQAFKPSGPAERCMFNAKALLREQLQEVVQKGGGKTAEDLLPETLKREVAAQPRVARVNTLKLTLDAALAWLETPPPEHAKHAAKGGAVRVDDMLPDVISFPSGTDLHDHPLVADRRLILQSRSSCMAACALRPGSGTHVIDCCAAPGNKTTHLAALMGGEGRIDAFELDLKRATHLQRNVDACGAANITVHQANFLEVDVAAPEYADVEAVLLDPSCSGSGTVHSRMDFLLPSQWQGGGAAANEEREGERLERLARFQEEALRHALGFPGLRRLVYSTCSVHERENEAVVAAVLPAAKQLGFRLKDPFPTWKRRGYPLFKGADRLVRVDPEADGTDGFFIALFERSSGAAPAATPTAAAMVGTPAAKPAAKSAAKSAAKPAANAAGRAPKAEAGKAAAAGGGSGTPGADRQRKRAAAAWPGGESMQAVSEKKKKKQRKAEEPNSA